MLRPDVAFKSSPSQAIVPARFYLHVLQIVPLKSHKGKTEYNFMVGKGSFGDAEAEQQVESVRFSVKSGLNIEVS